MATLYLVPTSLGECDFNRILPTYNTEVVTNVRHFIVEDVRTARRFLKKANKEIGSPCIDLKLATTSYSV